MRVEDWNLIAREVVRDLSGEPAGIVVLHGTDTLHYCAAALAFMLQEVPVPIVLSGSMIPGGDPDSDAAANLGDAVRIAATGDLSEVCVAFSQGRPRNGSLIKRG